MIDKYYITKEKKMKELRDERAETGEKMRHVEAYIGYPGSTGEGGVPVELGGARPRQEHRQDRASCRGKSPRLTPIY